MAVLQKLLILAAAASLAACVVPPADKRIPQSTDPFAGDRPTVISADGPLSQPASQKLIARLGGGPDGGSLLRRHLIVEEAVAGAPLTTDNAVKVLRDGDQTFAAVAKAIAGAKRTLNLEY